MGGAVYSLRLIRDVFGQSIVLEYNDENDLVETITWPDTRTLTFAYENDLLDTVTAFDGHVLDFDYTNEQLSKATFTKGAVKLAETSYTYTNEHLDDVYNNKSNKNLLSVNAMDRNV